MVYSSNVIDDLALLFPLIRNMRQAYYIRGLGMNYKIFIEALGYRVVFEPYGI